MGNTHRKEARAKPAAPKNVPKITEQERAILDLKNQRDKLHKYSKQLGLNIDKEKELARQALGAGRRDQALLLLKKKKYQEGLLEKAQAQHANIEEMANSLEFASLQKEVYERLKAGRDVLEAINKEMPIEEIEQLMQDSHEAVLYQQQISELLGGVLTTEDEEECLAELDALTAEEETTLPAMPEVPSRPLPAQQEAAQATDEPTAANPKPVLEAA